MVTCWSELVACTSALTIFGWNGVEVVIFHHDAADFFFGQVVTIARWDVLLAKLGARLVVGKHLPPP
jgi:hypothetical protein